MKNLILAGLMLFVLVGCGGGGNAGTTSTTPAQKTSAVDGVWKLIPTDSQVTLYDNFHLLPTVGFSNGEIATSDSTTTAGFTTVQDILNHTHTLVWTGTFSINDGSITTVFNNYNGNIQSVGDVKILNFTVNGNTLVFNNNGITSTFIKQ